MTTRTDSHARQQHSAQKGDNTRPRTLRRKIGGQSESDCLNGVQPGPHEKERQSPPQIVPRHKAGPVVSPERMSSANGMIAKPPNCAIVPNQMKGTRRQPSTER